MNTEQLWISGSSTPSNQKRALPSRIAICTVRINWMRLGSSKQLQARRRQALEELGQRQVVERVAAVEHDALLGECLVRSLTVSVLPVSAGPSGAPRQLSLSAPISVR